MLKYCLDIYLCPLKEHFFFSFKSRSFLKGLGGPLNKIDVTKLVSLVNYCGKSTKCIQSPYRILPFRIRVAVFDIGPLLVRNVQ